MANDARNLEQLLNNPQETLDVEFKDWLDLNKKDDHAILAKAIIAMANHGGGMIVIGFRSNNGHLSPSTPTKPEDFTTDAINSITSKFLDPEIQIGVERSSDPPAIVLIVPGGHSVPVRAKRGGPNNSEVVSNTYYIRRTGPKSEPPQTAHEWNTLIRRCVINDRNKLDLPPIHVPVCMRVE